MDRCSVRRFRLTLRYLWGSRALYGAPNGVVAALAGHVVEVRRALGPVVAEVRHGEQGAHRACRLLGVLLSVAKLGEHDDSPCAVAPAKILRYRSKVAAGERCDARIFGRLSC